MSNSSQALVSDFIPVITPWIIGGFLESILQGILFNQINYYYCNYTNDNKFMKLTIAFLGLITTLRTLQTFGAIWNLLNAYGTEGLNSYGRWGNLNPAAAAFVAVFVQCYYCYRLYMISRCSWILIPIFMFLVLEFIASIFVVLAHDRSAFAMMKTWYTLHLSSTLAADLLISSATIYSLSKLRQRSGPRSFKTLGTLLKLCYQCAIPLTLFTLVELMTNVLCPVPNQTTNIPATRALTACVIVVPKIYATTMMYAVNARNKTCSQARSNSKTTGDVATSTPPTCDSETNSGIADSTSHGDAAFDTISRIQMQFDLEPLSKHNSALTSNSDRHYFHSS